MTDNLLPPIFTMPDLRLVGVGNHPDGTSYMRFMTAGRSANPIREVVVLVTTSSAFTYEYSIYDGSLQIINQYRGPHGDPDQDEWIGSYGLQRKQPPMP